MTKEKKEFIEQMFDMLQDLPIESVIEKRVSLYPKGGHLMGLCPFHNDTHLGSFVVTPAKHLWKCFACGDEAAGNAIRFVSMYENLSYLDAAFKIAYEEGIISLDEYQTYSSYNYEKKYLKQIQKRYETKQEKKTLEKAPDDVCHNVYLFMKKFCGLSPEHREHLENVRKLSYDRIDRDYFSVKTTEKPKFIRAMKEKFPFYSDEMLSKVPGFFLDAKGKLTYAGFPGIGILIRDSYGKILAVQIRKDTVKDGEQRYVWFSSAFAGYEEKYRGGCGTGSPLDVLYPSQFGNPKKILCITEGRFKSEKLAESGNYAISVQGIGNWNGISECVKEIRQNALISQIFICYDSDLLSNIQGLHHSVNLAKELEKSFPNLKVRIALWKKKYGKGIDDVLIAGNGKEVSYFSNIEHIYRVCKKSEEEILESYGKKSFRELSKEAREEIKIKLQTQNEEILL